MNGSRNASVICLRQQVDNPENLQLVVGLYCYAVVAYNDYFAELVSFVTRDKKTATESVTVVVFEVVVVDV